MEIVFLLQENLYRKKYEKYNNYIYITIRPDLNFVTLFNSPIHDFFLPIATRLTGFCLLHLEEQLLITTNCRLYEHSRSVIF